MAKPIRLTDEQKRAQRIKKNKENMKIVKPDQIGVCQYIMAEIQQFEYDQALRKYKRSGSILRLGLQYENHVIFDDGSYRNLNDSSVRAVQIYQGEPRGVTRYLQDLYTDCTMFDSRIVIKHGIRPYSEPQSYCAVNTDNAGEEQ